MGIGTWGFAKGASKNLLDNIAARQEFDMQVEKEKKLAELRAEQQKDLYIFQKDIDRKDRDDKLTEIDYTSGFVIYRNGDNEEIGRRRLNQAELDAHNFETEKDRLDIEGKKLSMASTRQRMALDQQENARAAARHSYTMSEARRSGRSGGTGGGSAEGPVTADEYLSEIRYQFKDNYADMAKRGVPLDIVDDAMRRYIIEYGAKKKNGAKMRSIGYGVPAVFGSLRRQFGKETE